MANVLKSEKQEQVRALGRLGWSLRRIEEATGVRRETVSRYLRTAGIEVRGPRRRQLEVDSKAASEVPTDPEVDSKAASEVPTDLERSPEADRNRQPSACEPWRELIEESLSRGRNATAIWQSLVDEYGFEAGYDSVKRFVRKLSGGRVREAHPRLP